MGGVIIEEKNSDFGNVYKKNKGELK